MSLLLMAVKLYHPFDEIDRHARSLTDLSTLQIDWHIWNDCHKANQPRPIAEGDPLPRGSEINVTEADVMNMSAGQMDQYLDWFEQTWIDQNHVEHNEKGLPTQLLDMFPTGRLDGSTPIQYNYADQVVKEQENVSRMWRSVTAGMKPREVVPDGAMAKNGEPLNRIGSLYRRYDDIEDLQPSAKAVFEAAAKVVGVKVETLLLGVRETEGKFMASRAATVRAGNVDDEDQSTNSGGRAETRGGSPDVEIEGMD